MYDRESVMKGMGGMGMPGMGGGAASRASTALLRACMVVVRANYRVGMLGLSGGAAVANPRLEAPPQGVNRLPSLFVTSSALCTTRVGTGTGRESHVPRCCMLDMSHFKWF